MEGFETLTGLVEKSRLMERWKLSKVEGVASENRISYAGVIFDQHSHLFHEFVVDIPKSTLQVENALVYVDGSGIEGARKRGTAHSLEVDCTIASMEGGSDTGM